MSKIHDLEPQIPAARDGKHQLILSPAQERSWILEQLYPGRAFNHLSLALRLRGTLDWPALTRSLDEILRRQEVLRLAVRQARGRPVPELAPPQPLAAPLEDLTQLPETERTARARELAAAEARQPFEPGRPLLRARVLRLAPDDHLLILTLHRIAGDAQSLRILYREWTTLYAACIRGEPSPLPELPMNWFEFANRQRRHLEDKTGEERLAWWQQQLSGKLPVLDLPLDHSRPPIQTCRAATTEFALPTDLRDGLNTLAGRFEATLEEVLLAAFQTLLYRHTGQDDPLVGWPVSGRTRPGSESIIGPFENTLTLRGHLSGELSFGALVEQVRQAMRDAQAHQDVPFETLLNVMHAERDLSRSPVFQTVLKLEEAPLPPVELPGLSVSPEPVDSGAGLLDLALRVQDRADGLAGKVAFNPDLFEAPTIQRLIGHFETLLQGILADPEQAIARLPLLTEAERHQALKDWNQTQAEYPRSQCIHHLFQEQAERTPEAVALVFEDQQLTYRQLNAKADQLAGELRRLGVGPEVRVGICMTRSLEMVVGLYAIHKAGGAYVPMDPAYPLERLAFMLEDTQAPVLLTQQALRELLPATTTAKVVFADALLRTEAPGAAEPQSSPEANRSGAVTPDNLAYVIYTSGSTGKPKGVMVRHRNVVNFFTGMDRAIGRGPGVWLAVTSISFDISVLELFWTLTRGFKVVLQGDDAAGARLRALRQHAPADRAGDYTAAGQILRHGVTHLQCTPSLAGMMLQDPKTHDALRRVKHFLFGGEPLPPALVGQLAGSGEIFNMYGPTETTVWSTVHPVTRHGGTIDIGRPIANTEIYLLDPQLQPVPIGVPGELFIGGAGVVRGYLNRPELTEERFIRHPFNGDPDARLYRTGDLARYQADGTIEFLGRVDHQVKVRGFRIELGEIEAALRQHPSVRESAVAVWEVGPNDKRLVAYLVTRPGPKPKPVELRRFLQGALPEYMVPSTFIHLDALPLTPNGKIDRKALPAPEALRQPSEAGHAPPQTPLEQAIAAVWQELLPVERIGLDDDFFARGGTPLLANEAHARLCEALGMEFPLIKLFQFRTVNGLAKYLHEEHPSFLLPKPGERAEGQREEPGLRHSATNHQSMSQLDQTPEDVTIVGKGGRFGGTAPDLSSTTGSRPGVLAPPSPAEPQSAGAKPLPLTEAQREIWYGAQLSDEVSCSFNQSALLKLRGPLDRARLEQSFAWLVQRHEALRVTFSPAGEEQRVHAGMPVEVPFVDLAAFAPELRQKELNRLLESEVTTPFDLARGPLFRVRLVKLAEDEHAVLLTLHHIICDGASLGVLLEEWAERYSAAAAGRPGPTPLELPYSRFVLEQEASLQSPERTEAENFWVEQYSRSAPALELPTDRPRPARRKFTGGSERVLLNPSLTQALKRLSAQHRCTLTTTLLAGFYLLLHRLSGQPEIIIGLPITTRSGQGGEQLVGHCVNFLPLRLSLAGDPTFSEHLSRVWQLLLEAQGYQNFTLGSLLQKLNRPRDAGRMPLASVMFNLDWVDEPVKFAGLRAELLPNPYGFIRFDLSWSVTEIDGQLELFSQYSTELFDAETINRWFRHYEMLLAAIVANPDQPIDQLPRLNLPDGRLEVATHRQEPAPPAAAHRPAEPTAADEAPAGPVEETLAQIWREVVLLQEVGRHDNFFDVGGHSLLATKVIARINKTFNVQLSLRTIFEAPTIAELAEAVGQAQPQQPNVPSAITRRTQDSGAQELLERLNQLSDAELEELLRNPKFKDVLS